MTIRAAKNVGQNINQARVKDAMHNYYYATNSAKLTDSIQKNGYCTALGWRWQVCKNKTIQAKRQGKGMLE